MDKTLLTELYILRSMTIREIANQLELSVRAVREALREHGIALRQRGPRRDIAVASINEGLRGRIEADVAAFGIGEAAKRNSLSSEVVHAIRGSRPLPRGTKPKLDDAQTRREYDKRRRAGESASFIVASLATRLECSESTIRRSLRRTCVITVQQEANEHQPSMNQLCANTDSASVSA